MRLTFCAVADINHALKQLTPSVRLICMLLVLSQLIAGLSHAADPAGLSVGIFPRRDSETTRIMFEPLMGYLQQEVQLRVDLDVPPDFAAFWARLKQSKYDLVHMNQYQYLRAHHFFGYDAILKNEEMGRSTISSVIWVRKEDGIRRPVDLKGRKVIFGGGRQAMVSYIMAIDMLREHGLADEDYLVQFALNPVSAVLSLYYGQSMAAGSGDILPHLLISHDPVSMNEITPLVKSQAVAHLPWAVSPRLPGDLANEIRRVLTSLQQTKAGQQMLSRAGLSGLVAATDSEYDTHRRIISRVLREQY